MDSRFKVCRSGNLAYSLTIKAKNCAFFYCTRTFCQGQNTALTRLLQYCRWHFPFCLYHVSNVNTLQDYSTSEVGYITDLLKMNGFLSRVGPNGGSRRYRVVAGIINRFRPLPSQVALQENINAEVESNIHRLSSVRLAFGSDDEIGLDEDEDLEPSFVSAAISLSTQENLQLCVKKPRHVDQLSDLINLPFVTLPSSKATSHTVHGVEKEGDDTMLLRCVHDLQQRCYWNDLLRSMYCNSQTWQDHAFKLAELVSNLVRTNKVAIRPCGNDVVLLDADKTNSTCIFPWSDYDGRTIRDSLESTVLQAYVFVKEHPGCVIGQIVNALSTVLTRSRVCLLLAALSLEGILRIKSSEEASIKLFSTGLEQFASEYNDVDIKPLSSEALFLLLCTFNIRFTFSVSTTMFCDVDQVVSSLEGMNV
uniref:Uncharacterized protein n=1 Tax=Palpitomonas bilix TaxID=652834 RepID=A0A7S3LTT0_9EUKA|mmetsp:Transcript_45770/g.118306  ORF Transcript_45770/g.118306 Transcript_45770/m.118306 type:complete len:421 (+) Transcript_45770:485-1747(+)